VNKLERRENHLEDQKSIKNIELFYKMGLKMKKRMEQ
jgi:hypothetical protein